MMLRFMASATADPNNARPFAVDASAVIAIREGKTPSSCFIQYLDGDGCRSEEVLGEHWEITSLVHSAKLFLRGDRIKVNNWSAAYEAAEGPKVREAVKGNTPEGRS